MKRRFTKKVGVQIVIFTIGFIPAISQSGHAESIPERGVSVMSQLKLELPDADEALRLLLDPAEWKVNPSRPLFRSVPVIEKNGRQHGLADDLFTEIPNDWILKHELNLLAEGLPQQDSDGDDFTNAEEYRGGSDPKNAESHPAYLSKIGFVSRLQQSSRVRFDAQPDSKTFQFTKIKTTNCWQNKALFLKNGDTGPQQELRLGGFVDGKAQIEHLPTGRFYDLIKGQLVDMPIYIAELSLPWEEDTFFVKEGDRFLVRGERYRLNAVESDGVEIVPAH